MNDIKLALGIIVAPTDRESELLDRLLGGVVSSDQIQVENKNINLDNVDGVAKHVDGIFITITGGNKKCEEVAKKYGADISHYEWDKNFAKARNFNFSQVPKEYTHIYWADTDDVIVNPDTLKSLAEKMVENAIDAVTLRYFYEHDLEGNCIKEHLKTRIIKNDGSMEWMGAIHEDFKMNRQISGDFNDQVKHIHLTDPTRVKTSLERNKEISELEVKKNPKDPHTYWNLANCYLSVGRYEDAINIYKQFIPISDSEEERFLVWQMLAICYTNIGKPDIGIEMALEALHLRPWYPDAYLLLGQLNYHMGRMKATREFLEMGLSKPVPEFESIVWNPMDYTYNPNLLLAQTYASMNLHRKAIACFKACLKYRPKSQFIIDAVKELEKNQGLADMAEEIYKRANKAKNVEEVKKLLENVPAEMKYYPPIVSLRNQYFIKDTSNGKEVAIFCSFTSTDWNPQVFREKGVGGSEEAIIQLSKRFTKAGYDVTVFCSTPRMQEYKEDGVIWKPYLAWNYRDKYDIVILWRHPKMLDFPINSDKIYMDVHDVLPPEEFTTARLLKVTKVLFKSQTQRDSYPNIPDDKCAVIPHGLDIESFESKRKTIKRDPYKIVNTSSPDRSLLTSMEIVERVYNKLPDNLKSKLKFEWRYGFRVWDYEFSDNQKMIEWKAKAMEKMKRLQSLGIMPEGDGDMISQDKIVDKYLESGVMLYPSEFAEIGFISGTKSILAGCIPCTTSCFAQGEFLKDGIIVKSDVSYENWRKDLTDGIDFGVTKEEQINEFVDKIVEYMCNPDKYEGMRNKLIDYAKSTFDWDKTAESWINIWTNQN